MAHPLTWRNVDAPDFGDATAALAMAASQWSSGFNNISGTLGDIRARQKDNRSADALALLNRVASEGDVNAALQAVESQVGTKDRSDELVAAMAALRNNALGYDSTRSQNRSRNDANSRYNETHRRNVELENQLSNPEFVRGVLGERERAWAGAPGGNREQTAADRIPLNDRELLARTLEAEAGGEGYDGMAAVASVVGNRMNDGRYGSDLRDVILRPGQFSVWNSYTGHAGGEQGRDMLSVRPSEAAYAAADRLLSGELQDITGGATHYFAGKAPYWNKDGEGRRIGNHTFSAADGPARNYQPNFAGLVGDNNRIPVNTLLGIVDDTYRAGDERSRDSDDDRDRDFKFNAAVREITNRQQADELVFSAINEGLRGEDALRRINNADVSPEIKRMAISGIQNLPADELRNMTLEEQFDAPSVPQEIVDQNATLERDVATFAAQSAAAEESNAIVRANKIAEETYGSLESPIAMAKVLHSRAALPETLELADIVQAIESVSRELDVPAAQAAAYLEQTTGESGVGALLNTDKEWGAPRLEVNRAVQFGIDAANPDSQRAAAEIRTQNQQNAEKISALQQEIAGYELLMQRNPNSDRLPELAARREKAVTTLRGILEGNIPGRRVTDAPQEEAPGQAAPVRTNAVQATATGSERSAEEILNEVASGSQRLQQEAEDGARNLISDLTGLSPAQIARMDRNELKAVLERLEVGIRGRGLPEAQRDQIIRQIRTIREALGR